MFRLNRNKQKTNRNSLIESLFWYLSENLGLVRNTTETDLVSVCFGGSNRNFVCLFRGHPSNNGYGTLSRTVNLVLDILVQCTMYILSPKNKYLFKWSKCFHSGFILFTVKNIYVFWKFNCIIEIWIKGSPTELANLNPKCIYTFFSCTLFISFYMQITSIEASFITAFHTRAYLLYLSASATRLP
jgi:hypothetical protein